MKEKFGKYALLTFVWAIIISYLVCSIGLSHIHQAEHVVRSVNIEICDSTANGHLVSSQRVREWLLHSGINTIGTPAEEVNLSGIEQMIIKNGFVGSVDTYVTYDGILHIEVHQQCPMMRLLIDGYNAYSTKDGYVFHSPAASSLYVPVITGSYRPPFPPSYEGDIRKLIDQGIAESNERISEIEGQIEELNKRWKANKKLLDSVRNYRIRKGLFQSKEDFEAEVEDARARKKVARRKIRGTQRYIDRLIEAENERINAEYRGQKKLEKRYEDFLKLINFVEWLEEDSFWQAEIVQIVAKTMPSGDLELDLIPRSGNYTIQFGRIEKVEQKLDKLLRFYEEGLNNRGWDCYSIINVKYDGQVVCSK